MSGWLVALVIALALAVSVFGGWVLTVGVLRLAARSQDAGRPTADNGNAPAGTQHADDATSGEGRSQAKDAEPSHNTDHPGGAVPLDGAVPSGGAAPSSDTARSDDTAGSEDEGRPIDGKSPNDMGSDEAEVSDGPVGPRAKEALRGGTWIGILERVAVTGTLLADYPAGIAFVVAVKGLGRYPELREHPSASERFVIGTLASMVWSAGVGVLGRALLLT